MYASASRTGKWRVQRERNRHRGVDVRAGEMPGGVDHRHDHEAEGENDALDAERAVVLGVRDDRAAAREDECERSRRLLRRRGGAAAAEPSRETLRGATAKGSAYAFRSRGVKRSSWRGDWGLWHCLSESSRSRSCSCLSRAPGRARTSARASRPAASRGTVEASSPRSAPTGASSRSTPTRPTSSPATRTGPATSSSTTGRPARPRG